MSAIFILKKEPPKKKKKTHKLFIFLEGCYFVMGDSIDMNSGVL